MSLAKTESQVSISPHIPTGMETFVQQTLYDTAPADDSIHLRNLAFSSFSCLDRSQSGHQDRADSVDADAEGSTDVEYEEMDDDDAEHDTVHNGSPEGSFVTARGEIESSPSVALMTICDERRETLPPCPIKEEIDQVDALAAMPAGHDSPSMSPLSDPPSIASSAYDEDNDSGDDSDDDFEPSTVASRHHTPAPTAHRRRTSLASPTARRANLRPRRASATPFYSEADGDEFRATSTGAATNGEINADMYDTRLRKWVCTCHSHTFSRKGDLSRHLDQSRLPTVCDGCDARFKRKDPRIRHWDRNPECEVHHHMANRADYREVMRWNRRTATLEGKKDKESVEVRKARARLLDVATEGVEPLHVAKLVKEKTKGATGRRASGRA